MSVIFRTRRARADIVDLALYYGNKSPLAADRLLDKIDSALKLLADHPYAGRERADLRQGLRSFPVRPYMLFYLPLTDGVELIRVLHGARDIGPDFFIEE